MAITFGGNVGQAQSKTPGQTTVITCGSNVPVGGFVWISFTVDSDVGASSPAVTITDSQGNVYSQDDTTVGASGTARTGIRTGIAYCKITTALVSGTDTITMTTDVTNVVSRAIVAQWFDGVSDVQGDTRTTVAGSSGSTALTTPNAAAGEIVLCGFGIEDLTAPTYDADTTNGSWSTGYGIGTTGGGAASNVRADIQYKIVTGGGTQAWNLSHTNIDRAAYAYCFEAASAPPEVIAGVTLTETTTIVAGTVTAVTAPIAGATLTRTGTMLAAAVTAPGTVTLAGATLTAATTIVAGAVTAGPVTLAGATLSTTTTIVAGAVAPTSAPLIDGATLTAATTIVAGDVSDVGAELIAGVTLTETVTIVAGAVSAGPVTISGATLDTVVTIVAGTLAVDTAPIAGATLDRATTIVAGPVSADLAVIAGATLTETVTIVAGAVVSISADQIAGATLDRTITIVAGAVTAPGTVTIAGVTLTETVTIVAGAISSSDATLPTVLFRVTHRHIAHITHRHTVEVVAMSDCTERLVVPRIEHRADSTHPIGIIWRQDNAYLDGTGFTWTPTAIDPRSGTDVTPWSTATAIGQVGGIDTPSVVLTLTAAVIGLYIVTLTGVAGAVRELIDFELEVVGAQR
jgi:hypothetical protein